MFLDNDIPQSLKEVIDASKDEILKAKSIHELLHEIKPKFFGKKSKIAEISAQLKSASIEEKKSLGKSLSFLRNSIEDLIKIRLKELQDDEVEKKLSEGKIDGSFSVPVGELGSIHPISFVTNEVLKIFQEYGCCVATGPEIETEWFNFSALNIPEIHPARQMHDTFYLNGVNSEDKTNYLLRTHTTAVDIKALSATNPPLKIVSFGKTFRRDLDRTHSPMFHQIDFLEVGKDINVRNLKAVLLFFLKRFFETEKIEIRMRPSYFPFTEPSFEVDIKYKMHNGRMVPDKDGDKYMEILGCGILRPVVLSNCGVDASKYTAIAAGIGLDRMAMLKYGIEDIRSFFQSDIEWLKKESFSVNNI